MASPTEPNPFGDQGPSGGAPSGPPPSSALAIVGMIFGILSVLPICFCGPFSFICGLVGVICGFIGMKKAKEGTGGGKGMALAGVITGFIGLVLSVVWLVLMIIGMAAEGIDSGSF